MRHEFNVATRTHCWTFGGGVADVKFSVPFIVADEATGMDATADQAMIHGYKQKIADAAAISRDTTTGRSATDADKRAAMQEVVDRLNRGEWSATAKATGPKKVNVDALVAAIAAVSKKHDVVRVRLFVESKDDAGRKALAASEQFAEAYAVAVANARPKRELTAEEQAEIDAI